MSNTTKGCGCSPLNHFTTCDNQSTVSSNDIEVIENTNTIQPTDQILVLRGGSVYKASWSDLSPQTALSILTKATQRMGKTDPADGQSLWIDGGFIKVASGNPNDLGMQAQTAFDRNFKITLSELSTSDPGDGSPWLCGGVLMLGKNNTTKGCK